MADYSERQGAEVMELTDDELLQVHGGGDVVPTNQFSMNFAKIEFEYKPQKSE